VAEKVDAFNRKYSTSPYCVGNCCWKTVLCKVQILARISLQGTNVGRLNVDVWLADLKAVLLYL